jgi:hypothetical protein
METEHELILPQDVLTVESMKNFSPTQKFEYLKKHLLTILELNKDRTIGILSSELEREIEFSRNQIDRALRELLQLREIYAVKHQNRKFFYINGKVEHQIIGDELHTGDRKYLFKFIKNSRRKAELFIQEKSVKFFGGEDNKGAIMIPIKYLDDFIMGLMQLKDSIDEMNDCEVEQ